MKSGKVVIIVSLLLILIILTISIIFIYKYGMTLTGEAINNHQQQYHSYTYTTAICNKSNYCQDYEITCEGNETKQISLITGAAVQHDEDWKDTRNDEKVEGYCNLN